jgi:hypothetical protein
MQSADALMQRWRRGVQGNNDALPPELVTSFPIFHAGAVADELAGPIRGGNIPALPSTMAEVEKLPTIGTMSWSYKAITVRVRSYWVDLAITPGLDAAQRGALQLLGASLSHGATKNLLAYSEVFHRNCSNEIVALEQLNEALQIFIAAHSHLMVTATVVNTGGTGVTIRPHLGLKARAALGAPMTFLLAARTNDVVMKSSQAASGKASEFSRDDSDHEDRGLEAHVDDFLSAASAPQYISVPAGDSKEISAISAEPLGERSARIRAMYVAGGLACSLIGFTTDDASISSNESPFGEKVRQKDEDQIERALAKIAN